MSMTHRQFVQSRVRQMEELIAEIRAGRFSWCEDCESWVPAGEMRPSPWGGDAWPTCAECLAESGLEGNVLGADEADEEERQLRAKGERSVWDFEKIRDAFGAEEAKG